MVMLSAFAAPELNVPPAGFLCNNYCSSNSNFHVFGRVKMERGTSTLAVTVIENIDHQCDHEGCDASFPLATLQEHQVG